MTQTTTSPASLDFTVEGMTCGSCATRVQRILSRQPGVESAYVNYATSGARVVLTGQPADPAALRAAVEQIGYRLKPTASASGQPAITRCRRRKRPGGRASVRGPLASKPSPPPSAPKPTPSAPRPATSEPKPNASRLARVRFWGPRRLAVSPASRARGTWVVWGASDLWEVWGRAPRRARVKRPRWVPCRCRRVGPTPCRRSPHCRLSKPTSCRAGGARCRR